jgi:hypothetical protein
MRHADQTTMCDHEAATLLPWYVNGTLAPEERRGVENHLATCALCQDDLVALVKLQAGLRRELVDAPDASAALWQKVSDRITEPAGSTDRARRGAARARRGAVWAWVGDLLRPVLRPGWALAALLLIAVEAALIAGLLARATSPSGREYGTLTGPPTSGQPFGHRVRLRVAFVEQAREQAIRDALGELHATIVDGPSAAGFYVIDVPLDGGLKTPPEALRALRGRPDVVRFAELSSG